MYYGKSKVALTVEERMEQSFCSLCASYINFKLILFYGRQAGWVGTKRRWDARSRNSVFQDVADILMLTNKMHFLN